MTDADSGYHSLPLADIFIEDPEMLENGYIYIAQPPIYKVKRGKKEEYIKDEKARIAPDANGHER